MPLKIHKHRKGHKTAYLPPATGVMTLDLGGGPKAYALFDLETVPAELHPPTADSSAGTAPPPLQILAEDETEDEPGELAHDLAALEADRAAGRAGDISSEVMNRLLAGEAPLSVLAQARGLTLTEVADKAGLSQAYVSQLASGKRTGGLRTWRALAEALTVPLELLTETRR